MRADILHTIQLGSISSLRCQKTRILLSIQTSRMRSDVSRTMMVTGRSQPARLHSSELRRAGFDRAWLRHAKPRRRSVVEPDGIEPTTSCLQSTRSPS